MVLWTDFYASMTLSPLKLGTNTMLNSYLGTVGSRIHVRSSTTSYFLTPNVIYKTSLHPPSCSIPNIGDWEEWRNKDDEARFAHT